MFFFAAKCMIRTRLVCSPPAPFALYIVRNSWQGASEAKMQWWGRAILYILFVWTMEKREKLSSSESFYATNIDRITLILCRPSMPSVYTVLLS